MIELRQKLLAAFHIEYREHVDYVRGLMARNGSGPIGEDDLEEAHRRVHSLKGAARTVGLEEVEAIAHRIEDWFESPASGFDEARRSAVNQCLDTIEDLVSQALAPNATSGEDKAAEGKGMAWTRVETANLDRLLHGVGELLAHQSGEPELLAAVQEAQTAVIACIDKLRTFPKDLKVEKKDYASLMQPLERGARTLQATGHRLQGRLFQGRRLKSAVEQPLKRASLAKAGDVFGDLGPMIRQLAADQGKKVSFTVKGIETTADRRLLQRLREPLIHVLRNAVTHGLETVEARRRAGKPDAGIVGLTIGAESDRLTIQVDDDGAGLDLSSLVQCAIAEGRTTADAAPGLNYEEIAFLATQPGLSTAQELSLGAGRGMGLSAVHQSLAELAGRLSIEPNAPCGTRVRLTTPLTMLSTAVVFVTCREQRLALPRNAVTAVLRLPREAFRFSEGIWTVRTGREAQPLPCAWLSNLMGWGGGTLRDIQWGLMLRAETHPLVILTDEVLAVEKRLIEPLNVDPRHRHGIQRVVLHGAGRLALVLDRQWLYQRYQESHDRVETVEESPDFEKSKALHVLVVDDSITTRTLEKSLLEASGYRVSIATDGIEAWHFLKRETPNLIVTDIEMPNMNGFELLQKIKTEEALRDLPVILVTSRVREEDRERGLLLGADAYLVKREFQHRELLQLIRELA